MADMNRSGELKVPQDLSFQRREWLAERVGWILMGLVALAALLGLFGNGPLSQTTLEGQDGLLTVEYDRFLRYLAPTSIVLSISPATGNQREVRIWIDREYLQAYQLESVIPQPESVEAGDTALTFVFKTSQPGQPIEVLIQLRPEKIGSLRGSLGLEGGQQLNFNQFVYP